MSLEVELQYLLRCCGLFGICTGRTTSNTKCKLNYLYPSSIMLILLGALVYVLKYEVFYDNGLLALLVNTIIYISQTMTHIIIIIESMYHLQTHAEFHNKLLECEEQLRLRLKVKISEGDLLFELRLVFFILLAITCSGISVFVGVHINQNGYGFFWYGFFTILAMRLRFMQILIYLKIILKYFKGFNQRLQQIVVLRLQQQEQQHHILDINYDYLLRDELIVALRCTYDLFYTCICMLNEFCGWSLVAIILCYIFEATIHSYWSLLVLDGKLIRNTIIATSAILFQLISVVSYFCATCEKLQQENNLSYRYLQRLLYSVQGRNDRFQNLLFDFLLQMKHQPVQIAAKNIFTIDLKLLMMIFSSIVGYLIILIQFLSLTEVQGKH